MPVSCPIGVKLYKHRVQTELEMSSKDLCRNDKGVVAHKKTHLPKEMLLMILCLLHVYVGLGWGWGFYI